MKTILITGVSSGIGAITKDLFLQNGYHVIGLDINECEKYLVSSGVVVPLYLSSTDIYLNDGNKIFEPAKNSKLGISTSRKYDIELRTQYFYGYEDEIDRAAREQALIKEIASYLSTNLPDDVVLDANNDGIVDNMCIVLSGRSEISNRHLLWPQLHSSYLQDLLLLQYPWQPI